MLPADTEGYPGAQEGDLPALYLQLSPCPPASWACGQRMGWGEDPSSTHIPIPIPFISACPRCFIPDSCNEQQRSCAPVLSPQLASHLPHHDDLQAAQEEKSAMKKGQINNT